MLLALLLLCTRDYDGRFSEHPNRPEVSEHVSAASRRAPEDLPKWLAKRTPSVRVTLVDLAEPCPRLVWPGDVRASVELTRDKRDWELDIELPIDPFIADPSLAGEAVERAIFGAASLARAMDDGVSPATLHHWGLENPLIAAMASHWAGTLDQEIEFAMAQNLSSDEELFSLVKPIEPPADGGFGLTRAAPDDLTYHFLIELLAPKENDKKLATLYSALEKGQSLQQALEKASRKPLDRLNRDLAELYASFVEERLPVATRRKFWEAEIAFQDENWEALLAEIKPLMENELLSSHANFYFACELSEGEDTPAWLLFLDGLSYARSPVGLDSLRRCASIFSRRGHETDAREVYVRMRDEYGWVAGVRAEVEAALD